VPTSAPRGFPLQSRTFAPTRDASRRDASDVEPGDDRLRDLKADLLSLLPLDELL
jgi:hypothetical protein